MTPDDPRHGSYSGFQTHRREHSQICGPCQTAAYRARKVHRHMALNGHKKLVPIGDQVWQIAMEAVPQALADAIGINRSAVYKIRRRGPEGLMLPATKAAILSVGTVVSYIGLQRRLQAATAMGYSLADFAERCNGIRRETLSTIRLRDVAFVCYNTRREIVRVFNALAMTPAPDSTKATRCRNYADRLGWAPAFAWDETTIDDPAAQPDIAPDADGTYIDHAAVLLRMGGDKDIALNAAEQLELVHRMLSSDWSQNGIEEHTGINASRVLREERTRHAAEQDQDVAA